MVLLLKETREVSVAISTWTMLIDQALDAYSKQNADGYHFELTVASPAGNYPLHILF